MHKNDDEKLKALAAEAALNYIKSLDLDHKVIGIGTGSTTSLFIAAIANERSKEDLPFTVIASSIRSENLAEKLVMKIEEEVTKPIEVYVDGADEITPRGTMIKGGGGALFREKILSTLSKKMVVIVHEDKLKEKIGSVPLPLEITPFCFERIQQYLEDTLNIKGTQRHDHAAPYVTDGGNFLLDLSLETPLTDAELLSLHSKLINIPGIIDTGIFFNVANKIFIGKSNGEVTCIDLEPYGK